MRFENRRVLVTGSGCGIGKAIAHRYASGGAKVFFVARGRGEFDASQQRGVTRLGELADVAEVVPFLSSAKSRWMPGAIVDVDGDQNKGL